MKNIHRRASLKGKDTILLAQQELCNLITTNIIQLSVQLIV